MLVTLDTLRADHLPCYGYPRPTAPFVCELGRRGARFEHAFSPSPLTAPSHASIFTGRLPHQHGLRRNGAPLRGPNRLARAFAAAGFATAGFTGAGFLAELRDGFAHFHAADSGRRPGDEAVGRALEWLREDAPRRVFLWLHLFDVHEWKHGGALYRPALRAVREGTELSQPALLELLMRRHGLRPAAFVREGFQARRAVDRYDARIRHVDGLLRRLFDAVSAGGGRSLWVVTSDHGEGLGSHDYLSHGAALHHEQLRVPLVLFDSGAAWSERTPQQLVRLVDLHPTLVDLAGLPRPSEGHSFAPLLQGRPEAYPVSVSLGQRPRRAFSLHDLEHKVVAAPWPRFLDLRRDPLELAPAPRATHPAQRALARQLAESVRRAAAAIHPPAVPPRHLEELRALGYVE